MLSPNSAVVLVSANSTLALNDNSQVIGSLTGSGKVTLGTLSSTMLTIGADNTSPAAFTGLISGAGGLVKTGIGTLTLGAYAATSTGNANTYTGGTTVNQGTLVVANGPAVYGSATGTGPVTVANGATLAVTVAGGSGTIDPTGSNSVAINGGGTLALANNVTLTLGNGLILQPGAIISTDLAGTPDGLSGSNPLLAVTSGGFVATSGSYTVNLSDAHAGSFDLINYNGSTLSGTGPFAIGTAQIGYSYQLNLNTSSKQLDLIVTGPLVWTGINSNGTTVNSSWGTSQGSTNWSDGGAANYYTDGRAVIFADTNPITNSNVTNASVVVQSGGVNPASVQFTNAGSAHGGVDYVVSDASSSTVGISGSASVTLEGTGNVTFQSPNTFTGPVAINAGQLIVQNGTALGSSSGVTVASGAALTLSGGITVSGIPLSLDGPGLTGNATGA